MPNSVSIKIVGMQEDEGFASSLVSFGITPTKLTYFLSDFDKADDYDADRAETANRANFAMWPDFEFQTTGERQSYVIALGDLDPEREEMGVYNWDKLIEIYERYYGRTEVTVHGKKHMMVDEDTVIGTAKPDFSKHIFLITDGPTSPKPLWLVFYGDDGNREDCSVYYSTLVRATTAEEAIAKAAKHTERDASRLEAQQMDVLE